MQRTLVLISILGLVIASLGIGALAAHWPFWSRALAWHNAPEGWPVALGGPWRELRGAKQLQALTYEADPRLAELGRQSQADVLLVADGDARVRVFLASGQRPQTMIDGRGLVLGLQPLVYGVLQAEGRPMLLDEQIGPFIEEWAQDRRGTITPRQLMWQLSGLTGAPFQRFNPFSAQASLASGPDFRRAALAVGQTFPPGSHFEPAPANAQVLAVLAAELADQPYADVLESRLWSRVAASPARGLLDHRRGSLAAHCCFSAAAEDWLRIALLLADDGKVDGVQLLPPGYLAELATESPVHPGQGLGFTLGRDALGRQQSILQSEGRLLAATSGSGRALFWSGRAALDADLRERLMRELDR